MPDINIDDLKSHSGTMVEDDDIATAAPLREMIVTFDRDDPAPEELSLIHI